MEAEIRDHESSEIADSIEFPPIEYDVKTLSLKTECPVRMLVTDPDDFRVGFDFLQNKTVNDIPGALYYYGNGTESEMVSIPNQKTGIYSVSIHGTENGTYNLTVISVDESGLVATSEYLNLVIQQNEVQEIMIPEHWSIAFLLLAFALTSIGLVFLKNAPKEQLKG